MPEATGGGQTRGDPSGWSTDTLKEYILGLMQEQDKHNAASVDNLKEFITGLMAEADKRNEQRFIAQQKAVQDALQSQEKAVGAALAASEKAVLVAEANANKWRENANEWRGSMNDREKNFASRIELGSLKERVDRMEGIGKGVNSAWVWVVGAVAIGAAVVTMVTQLK